MTDPIYPDALVDRLCAGWYLTDEANMYIYLHLDPDDESAVRHVLRYLVVPVYEASNEAGQAGVKDALRWHLNCADDDRLTGLLDGTPDWPLKYASNPRHTYIWWWQELFGDEPWEAPGICAKPVVTKVSPGGFGWTNHWSPPVDEAVLMFRRRDGLPPGTDAPPVNKPIRGR